VATSHLLKPGCASPIVHAQHQGMNTSGKVTCHHYFETFPLACPSLFARDPIMLNIMLRSHVSLSPSIIPAQQFHKITSLLKTSKNLTIKPSNQSTTHHQNASPHLPPARPLRQPGPLPNRLHERYLPDQRRPDPSPRHIYLHIDPLHQRLYLLHHRNKLRRHHHWHALRRHLHARRRHLPTQRRHVEQQLDVRDCRNTGRGE
jgi:hypothetical protein